MSACLVQDTHGFLFSPAVHVLPSAQRSYGCPAPRTSKQPLPSRLIRNSASSFACPWKLCRVCHFFQNISAGSTLWEKKNSLTKSKPNKPEKRSSSTQSQHLEWFIRSCGFFLTAPSSGDRDYGRIFTFTGKKPQNPWKLGPSVQTQKEWNALLFLSSCVFGAPCSRYVTVYAGDVATITLGCHPTPCYITILSPYQKASSHHLPPSSPCRSSAPNSSLDCATTQRILHHSEAKMHREVSNNFLEALFPPHPRGFDLIVTQTVTRGLLGRKLMQMRLYHWLSPSLITKRWEQSAPSSKPLPLQ